MDLQELKQALIERAGLDPEQAERAARVALEFFAEKVPQAGDLVEKAGGVDEIAKRFGGLFGRD
jgi:hypothetical protein